MLPADIPEDAETVTITLAYRLHQSDEWTQYRGFFGDEDGLIYILAKNRTIVLKKALTSENEKIDQDDILNRYSQYPDDVLLYNKTKINLLNLQDRMLGKRGTRLTSLFPGWKENGGDIVPWFYPIQPGRHILEPAGRMSLDSAYQVEVESYYLNEDYEIDDSRSDQSFLQTMTAYLGKTSYDEATATDHLERLAVPEYIQAMDFLYYGHLTIDYLELPSTMLYVDTGGVASIFDDWMLYGMGFEVTKGYSVAEGNPRYTAEDGILYNKDKTQILGVPSYIESLTVPEHITQVILPYQSHIHTLTLEGQYIEDLPEIALSHLPQGCRLEFQNEEVMRTYLELHQSELARKHIYGAIIGEDDAAFTVKDDMILAYPVVDGVVDEQSCWVYRVLLGNLAQLSLPDYVTGISARAMESLPEVNVLFLPRKGGTVQFEEDGFGALTQIVCFSKAQYDAAVKAVSELASADRPISVVLAVTQDNGYAYMETASGGVILLDVPDTVMEFDGTFPTDDGTVLYATGIGDGAFQDKDQLEWVTLPQGLTTIGYRAFYGCTKLQGILIDERTAFYIGDHAFDGCGALRFIASNAATIYRQNDYDFSLRPDTYSGITFLYSPNEPVSDSGDEYEPQVSNASYSEGYTDEWLEFSDPAQYVYELLPIGESGRMLFLMVDGAPQVGLRSGSTVDAVVDLPEACVELFWWAMADTYRADDHNAAFTVPALTDRPYFAVDNYAFQSSGLGGDLRLTALLGLGHGAFDSCTHLTSVTFTDFYQGVALEDGLFTGCDDLRDIYFESTAPVELTVVTPSSASPFRFNMDLKAEREAELMHIHVPEGSEQAYIESWRYALAGYSFSYLDISQDKKLSAYYNLRSGLEYEYVSLTWMFPTEEELDEMVLEAVLTAENHLRQMLGLDSVGYPSNFYQYSFDYYGNITLRAAPPEATEIDLVLGGDEIGLVDQEEPNVIETGAFSNSKDLTRVIMPYHLSEIRTNAFAGVGSDRLDLWFVNEDAPELAGTYGQPFSFGVEDSKVRLYYSNDPWGTDFAGREQANSAKQMPEDVGNAYITAWAFPMAGYPDYQSMRTAYTEYEEQQVTETEEVTKTVTETDENGETVEREVTTEQEVTKTVTVEYFDEERFNADLLTAENRLRAMMGLDLAESADDLICLKYADTTWPPKSEETEEPDWGGSLPSLPDTTPTPDPDNGEGGTDAGQPEGGDTTSDDPDAAPGGAETGTASDSSTDPDSGTDPDAGTDTDGQPETDDPDKKGPEEDDTDSGAGDDSEDAGDGDDADNSPSDGEEEETEA